MQSFHQIRISGPRNSLLWAAVHNGVQYYIAHGVVGEFLCKLRYLNAVKPRGLIDSIVSTTRRSIILLCMVATATLYGHVVTYRLLISPDVMRCGAPIANANIIPLQLERHSTKFYSSFYQSPNMFLSGYSAHWKRYGIKLACGATPISINAVPLQMAPFPSLLVESHIIANLLGE